MSDNEENNRDKSSVGGHGGVELRDEGLRHVVGPMPHGLLWWSAIALVVGVVVVTVVGVILARLGVLKW